MRAQKKNLISADEAWQTVQDAAPPAAEELTLLKDAIGKILRRPVIADRDFPPFDRVTMDGIAISYEAFARGKRQFRIAHTTMAGTAPPPLRNPDHCIEIMTGAPLPLHADTVIRYEDIDISDGRMASLKPDATVQMYQNVHRKGSDATANHQLIAPGTLLKPAHIAIAAACGYAQLYTSRMPTAIVIGTGDELVPIESAPLPHQIRQSNAHMLAAALATYGISAHTSHLPDNPQIITTNLAHIISNYDLIIISGGVSAGKADYIPDLLENLGVEIVFHGVKQKPGKPLLFGRMKTSPATVFALPGNPVSAFMCLQRYVTAWLRKHLLQQEQPLLYARLTDDVTFSPALTYFLQVHTYTDREGICWAEPVAGGGSGDFVNLLSVNGFLLLPPHQLHFKKGETYPLLPF